MFWYESGSESGSEGSEIDKVREASRQLPPGWAPKRVLNSSCHRKKCTNCGCGWCEGDWYFTDVSCPWGADKICINCIDIWLIDNGIQESCSEGEEDEFGEETDEEGDEYDDDCFVNTRQGVSQPVVKPENNIVKTETKDVKFESSVDQEQTVKSSDQNIKTETVDVKLEHSDRKIKNELKSECEQSTVKKGEMNENTIKQEVGHDEKQPDQVLGVKRELDVVEEKNLTIKKIKTE
eukprot:TRINITY_DN10190_c0_g1_i1.p2 TRINITY_DN10190_c0_g1~~TRINITY_DN10190_c0_g1_i1.p2  ORF type:complete len:236 (-),score=49.13 TRINITY_DN10190_c0_g1_i1:496-1203(-)